MEKSYNRLMVEGWAESHGYSDPALLDHVTEFVDHMKGELELELSGIDNVRRELAELTGCTDEPRWKWILLETSSMVKDRTVPANRMQELWNLRYQRDRLHSVLKHTLQYLSNPVTISKVESALVLGDCKGSPVFLPDNLTSHRQSWQQALQRLIELEPVRGQGEDGADDRAYWEHELRAMRTMYDDLDRLMTGVQTIDIADRAKLADVLAVFRHDTNDTLSSEMNAGIATLIQILTLENRV